MDDKEPELVLIVDDNPNNLKMLSATLSSSGFDVAIAVSGEHAIRTAAEEPPDLILLDVKMAGIDGFETCRRLKADPSTSGIPVIFMTGMASAEDKVRGLRLGAVDYVTKPFLEEELLARVGVHTQLRRLMRSQESRIQERVVAERALQKLTTELERRIEERTAELANTLQELRQAQAHMAAVLRAGQAAVSEIILDKVLDQLLRIILGHAGAKKCMLLLPSETGMTIEAVITADPETVRLGLAIPVSSSADLARAIAEAVASTRAPVIIQDTRHDPRFASDPYLAAGPPMAVLCFAMICQGELTGILYLDGPAREAFASTGLETLEFLVSQAAIAVKNALLFARAAEATAALQRSNKVLEDEVALRTEELRRTNERLELELVERASVEQSRAALQQEIIQTQHARLVELSTPLIPITDKIMVMPLIGTIDSERAQEILTVALDGVSKSRASVLILDVTGVMCVDSTLAETLVSTAAALRLLGAQMVITGIRTELARSLVTLGIELDHVVAKGTLMSGIAYALERSRGLASVDTAARGPRARRG